MKNIYHRYIDLPFTLEKPSLFDRKYDRPYLLSLGPDYIPIVLREWLDRYDLTPSDLVEAFYTPSQKHIFIHTDCDQLPGENDPARLNFTWGPDTSVTIWWKIKDPSLYKKSDNTEPGRNAQGEPGAAPSEITWTASYDDVELVYEKVIDKPSLLNSGQLHSTSNPGNEDRWTWSFTLLDKNKNIVSFEKALEVFKDIIYE
jgi:hypothetical protein